MPDLTEDINVDELRRRARRRLVGAVVLALAAAVIVPMLLESEPRPLGEDVAVKIPPVDDGKFVNRLNDPAKTDKPAGSRPADAKDSGGNSAKATRDANAPDAAKAAEAARPRYDTPLTDKDAAAVDKGANATDNKVAAAVDNKGAPPSEAKSLPPVTAAPGAPDARGPAKDAAAPLATSPAPAPASPANSVVAAPSPAPGTPVVTAKAAPSTSPSSAPPAPPAKAAAPAASSPSSNGPFAVQLAAFSDDKGANALAGRLKRAGYTAYTEPYKTSKGTLWRVRVGPYPSREAATAARDKLKAEGQNGIVAAAHS